MTWTRNKWIFVAASVFLAQVAGIFALHTREPLMVRPTGDPRRPLISSEGNEKQISPEMEALKDPMIAAGAHPNGFSSAAWLTQPRLEYAPSNSTPPPRFLTYARSTNLPEADTSSERRGELPFVRLNLSNATPRSILSIEGTLAERPLVKNPAVPVQFATDVLSNTVVQVAVRADGFPLFTRIVAGSGSRAADLNALQIAGDVRFAPLTSQGRSDLQWGELVFEWFTAELPATNRPVPPPEVGPGKVKQ